MTKNIVAAVVGLGLATAALPRPASASVACSTGSLQVCASVSVSVTGSPLSWTIALTAFNLFPSQGLSHVMTTLGIGSLSLGDVWAKTATLAGPPAGWTQSTLKPNASCTNCFEWANNAVGAQIDLGGETTNGITDGIGPGGTLTLNFSSNSTLNLNVDDWVIGWHSQAVNGTGCSLWVDSNGTTVGGTTTECTNVVPEPMTMMLLGTGLTSMGGFGLLRRRKRNGDVEST